MRRLSVLVLLVALAVTVTGCTAIAPPGVLKPAAPRLLSEAELASALLTVSDLPSGYALDAEAGADGADQSTGGNEACDQVFDRMRASGSPLGSTGATAAEIEFTRGESGPFLSQGLYSSRDRAGVLAAFAAVRRIPEMCREFTETDEDGSFTIRLAEAAFPSMGDDSFAIRLDASGSGEGISVTLGGYLVLVRIAATMSVIAHVGLPGVDVGETEKVARAAAARLTPLVRPR
jgi:hypothetical protein